jgi:hypothetical protein
MEIKLGKNKAIKVYTMNTISKTKINWVGGGVKISILTVFVALVLFGLMFSSCKECKNKGNFAPTSSSDNSTTNRTDTPTASSDVTDTPTTSSDVSVLDVIPSSDDGSITASSSSDGDGEDYGYGYPPGFPVRQPDALTKEQREFVRVAEASIQKLEEATTLQYSGWENVWKAMDEMLMAVDIAAAEGLGIEISKAMAKDIIRALYYGGQHIEDAESNIFMVWEKDHWLRYKLRQDCLATVMLAKAIIWAAKVGPLLDDVWGYGVHLDNAWIKNAQQGVMGLANVTNLYAEDMVNGNFARLLTYENVDWIAREKVDIERCANEAGNFAKDAEKAVGYFLSRQ